MEDQVIIIIDQDGIMTVFVNNEAQVTEEQISLATSIILLDDPSFVLKSVIFLEKRFNELLFFIESWWKGWFK
jgi:hypothetical protein